MEKIRIRDKDLGSATLYVARRKAHPVVAGPEDRAEALHSLGVVNLPRPAHVSSEYPHRLVVAPGHDLPACGTVLIKQCYGAANIYGSGSEEPQIRIAAPAPSLARNTFLRYLENMLF
jgi:hypothetical protein